MRRLLVGIVVLAGCDGPMRSDGSLLHDHGGSSLVDAAVAPPDLPLPWVAPDLPPPANCLSGEYVGTYKGQIFLGNIFPLSTHGTVDLTLSSGGGEFFMIMNGHLMGDASGNPYSSDLVGTLDCTALKLVGGMLKNGQVTVKGLTYMFEGPLTADYDPQTSTFVNGNWNIHQIPTPSSTGMGTWTAKHK